MGEQKKDNFEKIYEEIEEAVQRMETGEQSLSESMKIYEDTTQKIRKAKKMLDHMEGKIQEITKDNS